MKPLLKWPGGKAREIDQISSLIPEYDRYIEPFFGGGAMFFHLNPSHAAINDNSRDLMEFYHLIRTQNGEFKAWLTCYAESFHGLLELGRAHGDELLKLFAQVQEDPDQARTRTTELLESWMPQIFALFRHPIMPDRNAFHAELEDGLWDKLCRTVKNHQKSPFSPEDLVENLVTGLASGYYLYFRQVFNDWRLGRVHLSPGQRMSNFFFIREHCYGSMFRYNKRGEFNVPYGGMSYNHKGFAGKVETLFQPETVALFSGAHIYSRDFEEFIDEIQPEPEDFMFLDPPYDTEFADYEGENFTKLDHARLAVLLSRTPCKFLLIIKNTPFIEALYSQGFYIRRFEKQYTYNIRSRNERKAEHLIVTNYPID